MAGHMVMLKWSMENEFGVKGREVFWPLPTSAGWSAIPTSSTRPCCNGCTTVMFEGRLVGTGRRHLLARHQATMASWSVHGADRLPRHQGQDLQGTMFVLKYDLRSSASLFLPASAPIPETIKWAERRSRCR